MKPIFGLVALAICGTTACLDTNSNTDIDRTDAGIGATAHAASAGTVPMWAFDKVSGSDSLTSVDAGERASLLNSPAWRYLGADGYLYSSPGSERAAAYRMWHAQSDDHLVTTSADERAALEAAGWTTESLIGYVSTVLRRGLEPMRRVYCPGATNHISTADPDRWDDLEHQGCTIEGVQGYVDGTEAARSVFASDVFNWRFYLNSYGDLLDAGLGTEQQARDHWRNFGIQECRQAHPDFHTSQYLDRYADLRNAYGSNCSSALQHYLAYGRNEGRVGYLDNANGRYAARNDIMTISASQRTAGAIDSLVWGGMEFVNSFDHGRQLQMALQLNGHGECENPTEAGNNNDRSGDATSSELIGASGSGAILHTQSRPAYWIEPGGVSVPLDCTAVNSEVLSDITIDKTVTAGALGLEHLVQIDFEVTQPVDVDHLVVEALAAYLNGELDTFYTFAPSTGSLVAVTPAEHGSTYSDPVVIATADQQHAFGIHARNLPDFYPVYHGARAWSLSPMIQDTSKTNTVYWRGATAAGTYHFTIFVTVGTLEDVRDTLEQLIASVGL